MKTDLLATAHVRHGRRLRNVGRAGHPLHEGASRPAAGLGSVAASPPSASFIWCASSTKPRHDAASFSGVPADAAGKEMLLKVELSISDVCLEVDTIRWAPFPRPSVNWWGFPSGIPRDAQAGHGQTIRHGHLALPRLAQRNLRAAPRGCGEGPALASRFTFVGTFTRGVPLGVPFSGTVMAGRGGSASNVR